MKLLAGTDSNRLAEIAAETMPNYATGWLEMIAAERTGDRAKAMRIVRRWQRPPIKPTECKGRPPKRERITFESRTVVSEIKAFLRHDTIKAAQRKGLVNVSDEAYNAAKRWAVLERGGDAVPLFGEYAFFFDLRTQNGLKYASTLMKLVHSTSEKEHWKWNYNRAATSWIQIKWD